VIETDILVILDRSGSMQDRKSDHEGGLRSFVEDQQRGSGDVRFTLVQFDTADPCEIVYDRVAMNVVGPITLIPRGGTPLLDAIGKAVAHLRLQQVKEPATQTIVMIITDGYENSSTEWTLPRVKDLLTETEKNGAKVLFLGADIDAFDQAAQLGVMRGGALNFAATPQSIGSIYCITSDKVLRSRQHVNSGGTVTSANAMLNYTDEERSTVLNSTTKE
jgi:uncharacterized protein YegL